MRRNARMFVIGAVAAMASALASARAEMPAVLDRIPAEAVAILATGDLEQVDQNVTALLTASELPQLATPSQVFAMIGLREGFDMARPMAVALMPGDFDEEYPPAVALMPTSDFGGLMQSLSAKKGESGLHTFTMQSRETLFAKKVDGGYAAMGPKRDVVAAFTAAKGQMAEHRKSLGKVGFSVADRSDIFAIVKKSLLTPMAERLGESLEQNAQMAGMMGAGDPQQLKKRIEALNAFVESMVNDANDLVIGARSGASGMWMDFAMDFTPGTKSAEMFNAAGNSGRLMKMLPNKPYLFASAGDFSVGGMRDLFKQLGDLAPMGMGGGDALKETMDLIDGQASAIYPNPGGLMAGLFANTINVYRSSDPSALKDKQQALMESVAESSKNEDDGGEDNQQARGMRGGAQPALNYEYESDATEVDGVSVDAWSMSIDIAGGGGAAAMQQQSMTMLFGPGGMGGYYAATDNAVYQTMSKNSELLSSAFKAGKRGESLGADPMLRKVGGKLPQGRTAEGYIGVGPIIDQVFKVMGNFAMPVEADLPDEIPPIGVGMTTNDMAARATLFVPSPTIKTINSAVNQARSAMMERQRRGGQRQDRGQPPF